MFDFTDTEAAHLSEIYNGLDDFEPYSDREKRAYLAAKGIFPKSAAGKYVIVQSTTHDRNLIKRLFLVDRRKTKCFWWSHDAHYALLLDSKQAADNIAARYKYNNVRVKQIK